MSKVIEDKCNICGEKTLFTISDDATLLREAACSNCKTSIRTSDLIGVLKELIDNKASEDIQILNLCSQGKVHELYGQLPGYHCGEFFDNVSSGDYHDGVMCVDLQNIPFEDNYFDIVVTEDVLEHVFDINKALKEINRVLKMGGKHIFTVPLHENIVTMSRKNDPLVVMHGDPLRSEGAKVITDFGRDIVSFVDRFGMKTEMHKLHIFHAPNETSYIDDEADFYRENWKKMLEVFRYNSIVFSSEKIVDYSRTRGELENGKQVDADLQFTGERFVPGISGKNINGEHYQRYHAVLNLVKGKKVLDAACGAGYGSALMSAVAAEVTGIDISAEAVAYAKKHYAAAENLDCIEASVAELPFPDKSFDVIVSFETIEHVDEEIQNRFIKEIKRCLKEDGVLVMSSPDKRTYSDIPHFNNEFHVKEFYFDEFDEFLKKEFKYINYYTQGEHTVTAEFLRPYKCDIKSVNISDNIRFNKDKDLYYIAVCSNREIDANKENISSIYGFEQIPTVFFFTDNEYTAEKMVTPVQFIHEETYFARFDLRNIKTEGRLRFDPLEKSCCEIEFLSVNTDAVDYRIVPINAVVSTGNKYAFIDTDPITEMLGDFSNATFLEFRYKLRILPIEEVSKLALDCIAGLKNCINAKEQMLAQANLACQEKDNQILERDKQIFEKDTQIHGMENEIRAIKSTRGYRLLENARKIRNRFVDNDV